MTATPLWLGVDVGTQSLRVHVLDDDARLLAAASVPLRSTREDGRHEQDPEEWWHALCAAAREAEDALPDGLALRDVAGVGLDTTSGTLLLVDGRGTPVTPALMYDDARAGDVLDDVRSAGAHVWDRLGYRVQASWALPKLIWLARHGHLTPGVRVRHSADHVAARLCGHHVATDWSHALKTGYDLDELRWPEDVLDALGLPAGALPDVVRPGSVLGTVSPEAAELTGLRAGTPVHAGMTDGCVAQVAAGALGPGAWNSVLGTTLVLKGVTTDRLADPTGAVYSHRHPDGGWLPGGASSTGTGALVDRFGADHYRLDTAAAAWEPSSGLAWPLGGHGERFPIHAPDARAFESGTFADEGDRYAAWLQGLAFVERYAFEHLRALGADTAGPLTLTGGGSRSAYLCQLRADVLGRPVTVLEDAEPASGAALLAAAGTGPLAPRAATAHHHGTTVEPRADVAERMTEAYEGFVAELGARGWLSHTH